MTGVPSEYAVPVLPALAVVAVSLVAVAACSGNPQQQARQPRGCRAETARMHAAGSRAAAKRIA